MSEFASRIEAIAADRAAPVRAMPAVTGPERAAGGSTSGDGGGAEHDEQARRDHMASASDYARVQARIADILADVDATTSEPVAARDEAANRLEALKALPVVIVPMPPACVEQIERAVALVRDMAEKASLARSAQAKVQPGTVAWLMKAAA